MNDASKKNSPIHLNHWLEWRACSSEKLRHFKEATDLWSQLLVRLTRQSALGYADVTDLAAVHYRLGLAHRALNDDQKSIYHLKYSVRLNSSEPRYYEAFGKAFLSSGHWLIAKTQFEKAIKLAPRNVTYLRQYASVLLMMGRKTEALIYAEKAFKLKASKESLMSLVKIYMDLEMYLHARKLLKRAKRSEPVALAIQECEEKLETTAEGSVFRFLRKGMICDGRPFSLWDLRKAEEIWTNFCLSKSTSPLEPLLPNVWAAAVAWLAVYLRSSGERMELDDLSNRFSATTLEVWPRIKDLQMRLKISFGTTIAA